MKHSRQLALLAVTVSVVLNAALAFVGCGSEGEDVGGDASSADGSLKFGDGGASCPPDAASPVCPGDFECGLFTDLCGGSVACGKACTAGKLCDSRSHKCVDKVTYCQGYECGMVKDACGSVTICGSCPTGKVCNGATFKCVDPPPPVDSGCGSLSCTTINGDELCGALSDGCGHTKNCACTAPKICGGGGPGICGIPAQCTGAAPCGQFLNACGNAYVNCGACGVGMTCDPSPHNPPPDSGLVPTAPQCGKCTPNPNPCAGWICGQAPDGCGKLVQCNSGVDPCTGGATCYGGQCCKPKQCSDFPDAGCQSAVDLGCGQGKLCGACAQGQQCVKNACVPCPACNPDEVCTNSGTAATCCKPKTCADFVGQGCGYKDFGCNTGGQYCNPCAAGQVCLANNTCCSPIGCNGRLGLVDNGCGGTLNCGGSGGPN